MNITFAESYTHHLCLTCRNGRVTTMIHRQNTVCSAGMKDQYLTQPVVRCTDYEFRYGFIPHEMDKVAWVLELKPDSRGEIGFRPPKRDEDK